ncbi:MAG: tetratricopeptide repeat protein [Fidelibacterota bacterium]
MRFRGTGAAALIVSVGLFPLRGQTVDSYLDRADERHEQNDFPGSYELLKDAEELDPDNLEVLWRLARAHFDFSDNTDDEELIESHVRQGFEYAQRALGTDDASAKAHKWYGILIGRVGEIEGTEQKIKNSYKVAEHTLRAIELDPEDDGTYHVMGRWHFTLADLNWFERTIASLVYAAPPEASFEEARDYFQKAIDKEPGDIRHYVWLGKTLIQLDDEEGARGALNRGLAIRPQSESDRLLQDEARDLLGEL